MPPLRTIHTTRPTLSRTASIASTIPEETPPSETGSDDAVKAVANAAVNAERKTRKRITVNQLATLEKLFAEDSKPPRDRRDALAKELKMETKAVTTWFQNKRQALKRTSSLTSTTSTNTSINSMTVLRNTANIPPRCRPRSHSPPLKHTPYPHHRPRSLTGVRPSTPPPPPIRRLPRGSLERVASLSELPSPPPRSIYSTYHPDHEKHLWNHMLSSPVAPSVDRSKFRESTGLTFLEKKRTLEWACANARGRNDEDVEMDVRNGKETDEEEDGVSEAHTPSEGNSMVECVVVESANEMDVGIRVSEEARDREMEAALALCGLLRG